MTDAYHCADHDGDRECPVSCIWRARAADAAARAAADDAAQCEPHWAEILKPETGQIFRRVSAWRSVVAEWSSNPRLRVIRSGTGTPPWSTDTAAAVSVSQPQPQVLRIAPPAAPVVIQGPGEAPDARAQGATCPTTEPPCPLLAEPASPAPAPAGLRSAEDGAAPRAAEPDIVNLRELLAHDDTRIASAAKRLRQYLAQHKAGVYVPPRFVRKPVGPAGF